ncbi:MAG: hypothetical protein U0835_23595 [Isosphaeraceae bacterium]
MGEVFITAGQSNAVNSAEIGPGRTVGDRIASFSGKEWAAARIPLPFAQGDGDAPGP